MHSNLSPYLIDVMTLDAERAARRARHPDASRRRLPHLRFPRRRSRDGRPSGRIAPA
jgi:hypothetical protein